MSDSKVTLKLLIDKGQNKVLFAEAGKDCIDFLFNIMSIPLGTVIRLLNTKGMVGCLGNLYKSIQNLDETYIQQGQSKDTLLKPKAPDYAASVPLIALENAPPARKKIYTCSNYQHNPPCVTDGIGATCPNCGNALNRLANYITPPGVSGPTGGEGGFVKGVVTYTVMDDLSVQPMSTISSITMLNKFNVKDVGALEEKVVDLGMDEALKLLKASFQSKAVLTSVFLSGNCV